MDNKLEENSSISRRDFLKLKGMMLLWFYFLQTLGINILADDIIKKPDYEILDKLLKLPFSESVKKELEIRVFLQKKYCYDGNRNLHSLNRFIKEITNYIISNQDLKDFQLLNSINDPQIDHTYMLNCTAKHNQVNSLKYLQKKLLSLKDNTLLTNALEYAINSQSYETTIHLMKQKLKLDDKTQDRLLGVLQRDEYEIFYKKISNKKNQVLLPYKKSIQFNKRFVAKKQISKIYYNYEEDLFNTIYNSVAQLYMNNIIDDFEVRFDKEKVYVKVWNYSGIYPLDFIDIYTDSIRNEGYDNLVNEYSDIDKIDLDRLIRFKINNQNKIYQCVNSKEYYYEIDNYDLINIEIL